MSSFILNAAVNGDISAARTLISAGNDVNKAHTNGTTALIESARIGHFNIVRLLLDSGADINYTNDDGTSALMACTTGGYVDVVELLLARGAEVNIKDKHGYTSLIEASFQGHVELIEMLLAAGADPACINEDGNSAADCAKTPEIRELIEKYIKDSKLQARAERNSTELQQMRRRLAENFQMLSNNHTDNSEKPIDEAGLITTIFAEFSLPDVDASDVTLQQLDMIESHPHLKEYFDYKNLKCARYAFLCCTAASGLMGSIESIPHLLQVTALLFKEPVVTYLANKLQSEDHSLSILKFSMMSEKALSTESQLFIDQLSREITLVQRSEIECIAATALRAHDTMLECKQQIPQWLQDGNRSNVEVKAIIDVKHLLDGLLCFEINEEMHFDDVEQLIQMALHLKPSTNEEDRDVSLVNGILLSDMLKQIRMIETHSIVTSTASDRYSGEELEGAELILNKNHGLDACCSIM